MLRKKFIFGLLLVKFSVFGQIDHYETIIYPEDTWMYFVGTEEPNADWKQLSFDDSAWLEGEGGFGYGDDDDNTIISSTTSLYLRVSFTLSDTSILEALLFHIDYDDAFVAYINGNEIARAGITGIPPAFNQFGDSHEAVMKNGGTPDLFKLEKEIFSQFLNEGNNLLAIQIHNATQNSSDLSAIPFLSVGVNTAGQTYRQMPDWFVDPIKFTSSNLPIVLVNTQNGVSVVDEPKTKAHMKIIYNEAKEVNYINDLANVYDGNVGIEIRGSYSSRLPQKPYGFETRDSLDENLNVPLLGMPKENDWILLANYNDKILMRNTMSFDLYRKMGHYAPETKHCELVLNDSYEGIYVLTEKIKRDKGRVDIAKLDSDDNLGDSVTGGYVFKIDYFDDHDSWKGDYSPIGNESANVNFVYHDPDADEITEPQKAYIKDYVSSFESVLYGNNFKDKSVGYRSFIDVKSFIDYFIMGELSRNVDAYKKSKYYFKDKDSKGGLLHSGPVWDYDWAYKNLNGGGKDGSGWVYTNVWPNPTPDGWVVRLMQDSLFIKQLGNRYHTLRETMLSIDSINAFIDAQYTLLTEAQERHYQRWPILGINVGAPENEYQPVTFDEERTKFKNWLETRLAWLDDNMPGVYSNVDDIFKEEESKEEEVINSLSAGSIILRVFPNPVTEYFYVESDTKIQEIQVYNSMGQMIDLRKSVDKYSFRFDFSNQTSGICIVKVLFENNQYQTVKILVR